MSEPTSCITVVDYFGEKVEAPCPYLLKRMFALTEGDNTAQDRMCLYRAYYICLKTEVAVPETGSKGLDFLHSICPMKKAVDAVQGKDDFRELIQLTFQKSRTFATMKCDMCSRFMRARVVDGKLATTCVHCLDKTTKKRDVKRGRKAIDTPVDRGGLLQDTTIPQSTRDQIAQQ